MNHFDQKFIEDPVFIKWIFNASQEIESYWEQYMIEHPEDKPQLLDLKDRLSELKFTGDKLLHSEKEELENQIRSRINLNKKNQKRRLVLNTFMKYAAVALIFLLIGGLSVYLNTNRESFYRSGTNIAQIPAATQGPLLITSNGKKVNLIKPNSSVDYSQSGTVVLNNDSIIKTTEEKSNVMNQIVIPYGNQSRVVLSDNTIVWLNAGSRLVYPTLFKDKTREVLLFGEAYFEVAKNPEKPFIVRTSNIDIRVLGTKFNISTYTEDNLIQTVLKEGSVAIRRIGANFFEKDIILKPNQMASFDKTLIETKIQKVDADDYTLWTKGLIDFEETDFRLIIKKIERYYNISIHFSDPQKETMRISGKLDLNHGRKEVMEYLAKVSLSRFDEVNEDKFTIN